jgi:TonB family protein
MRRFFSAVLLLPVLAAFGIPQEMLVPAGNHDVRPCVAKVLRTNRKKFPSSKFRKGEKYKHSPVVSYEILESGEIAHPILKRSSGVAEVDRYALKWVQGLKFSERPGCGVIESTIDITIDFR